MKKLRWKSKNVFIAAVMLTGISTTFMGGCANALDEPGTGKTEVNNEETILTAFVQQSVASEEGIWEGWGAEKLYKDTNIKVDFYTTGNEVEQKLNQYMAAGNLPDIIGFRDLDQAQLLMEAGLLYSLEDSKELLPSIFNTEEYQSAIAYTKENTSKDTGKLFFMPTSIGPVSYNAYNWVPLLQWDAYKQAGSPKLHTLEDYLDVVEKMVQIKPVTDSGDKVYGFSLFSDWDKYSALEIASLSYFYGIDTEYVSTLMETNVLTKETNSILKEDSFYKRALKFYYEANQRGLLDPDSATQSYRNLEKKYSEGRVMFSWFSWLWGTYNNVSSGHVNNVEKPDGYANILADDMKLYEAPDQVIGRNWYFAISKNCKNIEKACEFLNWLYTPKVQQYLYNGPEGSVWKKDQNGEPYVTEQGWDIINQKSDGTMPAEGGGSFQNGVEHFNGLGLQASTLMEDGYTISYRYWPTSLNVDETLMQKEVGEMLGKDVLADYLYENDMVAKSTIAVNMIPPVSDTMENKITEIGEVVRNNSWDLVYAKDENEFEQRWEDMAKKAKELGMDEVEQYYQKAWKEAIKKAAEFE